VYLLFRLYMAHPDTVYDSASSGATPATSARLFPLLLQQLAVATAAHTPAAITTTAGATAAASGSLICSRVQCAMGQQLVRAARELQCAGWESATSGSGDAPQLQQQQQREHAAGVHATFLRDVAVRHPIVLLSRCSAIAAVLQVLSANTSVFIQHYHVLSLHTQLPLLALFALV
jgi:hypothetical protein